MKILGLTPARGGSKSIPYKNIKKIGGKPLIAWTIEQAKKSRLLSDYMVSTEDEKIAALARKYKAEVLKRPKYLAKDTTTTLAVLRHAVSKTEADIVVLLQATSPVRGKGLIDYCIERFLKTGVDSLATGFICKYAAYASSNKRRQDIKGFFYDDGNVYVIKADLLRKGDRYGRKIERVCLNRPYNIDIDDEFDFWVADRILKEKSYLLKQGKKVWLV